MQRLYRCHFQFFTLSSSLSTLHFFPSSWSNRLSVSKSPSLIVFPVLLVFNDFLYRSILQFIGFVAFGANGISAIVEMESESVF